MPKIRFTVLGQPASKGNRRRFVLAGGKPRSIKSAEALAFEAGMLAQVPPNAKQMLSGDCAVRLRIYYRSNRSDLDESVVLDCLQARYVRFKGERQLVSRGVVQNDRQFKRKFIYHAIDPVNPRVEVTVWQLKPGA